MPSRLRVLCLAASTALTMLAAACGGTQDHVAQTISTTSTTTGSPSAYWLRTLSFNAPVHAPAGAVGIATPEFPAMIVPASGSIWVFPHHAEFAYRVDPAKNRVLTVVDTTDASCTLVAAGGGLVWTSNCGSGSGVPGRFYGIDPVKAHVALRVPGMYPAFGDGSLWVLDDSGKWVRRVAPRTGVTLIRIPTHSDQQPGGGTLVLGGVGYGSAWLDSDADKTVTRISTATNRVTAVHPAGWRQDTG